MVESRRKPGLIPPKNEFSCLAKYCIGVKKNTLAEYSFFCASMQIFFFFLILRHSLSAPISVHIFYCVKNSCVFSLFAQISIFSFFSADKSFLLSAQIKVFSFQRRSKFSPFRADKSFLLSAQTKVFSFQSR